MFLSTGIHKLQYISFILFLNKGLPLQLPLQFENICEYFKQKIPLQKCHCLKIKLSYLHLK